MEIRGIMAASIAFACSASAEDVVTLTCQASGYPTNEVQVAKNPREEEAKLAPSRERIMVPVTNIMCTAMGFRRNSPPPWLEGNFLSFHFRKSAVTGQQEEWASWQVVNIHADNFGEITRRLGIAAVEVCIFPTMKSPMTIQPTGGLERKAIRDEGYAIIIDPRIPQQWLLQEPIRKLDQNVVREIRAAFPGSFRASDTNENRISQPDAGHVLPSRGLERL